jgi:hypothetical protein
VRTLTIWRLHVVYWISKPTRAEAQASGRVSHQPPPAPPPPPHQAPGESGIHIEI